MAFVIAVRTTDALRLNHSKKAVEQLHDLVGQNNTFSWEYVLYFLIIPLAVYSLIWIPDLRFNTEFFSIEIPYFSLKVPFSASFGLVDRKSVV